MESAVRVGGCRLGTRRHPRRRCRVATVQRCPSGDAMQIHTTEAELAVDAQGSGDLVVLHPGAGRPAGDLADLAAALREAGFRTALVSPRGVGSSSPACSGLNLHDYARDLAQVIEALGGQP